MPEIPAEAACAKGKDEPKHSDTSSAVDRPGLLPLSLETTFSEGQNAHAGVMFPSWGEDGTIPARALPESRLFR
jgi:hypothetical protein